MAGPRETPRETVAQKKARDLKLWLIVGAGLLLLLSIFSEGFFLYIAMAAGGLYVFGWLVATIGLLGVSVQHKLERTEIELGENVTARLKLRNAKEAPAWWLLWRDQIDPGLDVEGASSAFRNLAAGETHELVYKLHSLRRGLFQVGPVLIESSGPFGLVRRFEVGSEAAFVTVMPRTVAIGEGWPLGHRPIHEVPRRRSLFEDPTRFLGIRDYHHGDELRRVHWRATARALKLQVKLYEPSVLEGVLLAVEMSNRAFNLPVEGSENEAGDPLVELTVTAAASIADFVLAGGQKVALVANGNDAAAAFPDDWQGGSFQRLDDALADAGGRRKITTARPLEVEPAKGSRQRDRLRTALARLVPAPGPSLPEMLDVELPRLPRSLVMMVVTPRLDQALGGVLSSLKRSGIEVGVVWIGGELTEAAEAGNMPEGVPVYAVSSEDDLVELGGQQL